MATPLNVAVIGAGVSGILAARELQREGHRVTVFEKSNRLGGTWVYDPRAESDELGLDPHRDVVHSSLYESLRTNLPRQLMGFSDFEFEDREYGDPRLFPGHEEVLKFLEDFAAEFGVPGLIRFGTEVVRVERVDSGSSGYVVESRTNGVSLEEVFDAIVVCSGHHTEPRVASDIPGIEKWTRKQAHSHNYRVPEPFRHQVVVMIGSGPSAYDISREITSVAKEVHLSSRSPNVKVSKLDGYHNLWQHSKIECVSEDGTVTFHGGFSVEADVIFHCTGYKFHFPFLRTNGILGIEDNRVGPLYKHVFPPQLAPRLSFMGLAYNQGILFRVFELQSKWIARTLSGKILLPSEDEMLDDINEHYRQMEEKGLPKHHTHSLFFEFDYAEWLASQLGLEVEDRFRDITRKLMKRCISDPEGFRDAIDVESLLSQNNGT